MSDDKDKPPASRRFSASTAQYHKDLKDKHKKEEKQIASTLTDLYAGMALHRYKDGSKKIGISIHDGTYTIDFLIEDVRPDQDMVSLLVGHIRDYSEEHCCKILGIGVSLNLREFCPNLCPTLWKELDVIPFTLRVGIDVDGDEQKHIDDGDWTIDEEADSLARKCLMLFSPTKQPRTYVGYRNDVQPDSKGRVRMNTLDDYRHSVRETTWKASEPYIKDLVDRKVRIVFFSATPQGGGVALMRHALLRYFRALDVHIEWYVPRPAPDVFRITKTNHNILQGVVDPSVRQKQEDLDKIKVWVRDNAERYWRKDGGPLAARSKGGADIIVVDDPQMPEIIPLAKEADPDRPVIFRSHIEVRDDLVKQDDSAAREVWDSMWPAIKQADLFLSHPVKSFVPSVVRKERLGWLPASTDWLDGLNKTMRDYDVDYYPARQGTSELKYPRKRYICQIARFDPAKGIPDVIQSFSRFRSKLREAKVKDEPQLVICGHSSVDDPDGAAVFDKTMKQIQDECQDLLDDIIIARLGPSDQMLNAIISKAEIVLQLSTREGFEVKVSEALHKGKPVVVTNAGGIPLQVNDKHNGFVVSRNDPKTVAQHLFDLWTDQDLYQRMSDFAIHNVPDEVSTVGSALSWAYLASKMTQDKNGVKGKDAVKSNGKWINDLAREEAGVPYEEGEPRLWRDLST